jgi:hypothetical protein
MADEPDESFTDMYHLLDALEAVIRASDPDKRQALAKIVDDYAEDFPDEFQWAVSAQSPVLLYSLMNSIDAACRPSADSKPRPVIRLVERKPPPDKT